MAGAGDGGQGAAAADERDALIVRVVDLPPEATLDVPVLADHGFRPLVTAEIGPAGVAPVPTRIYCAKYGDAYAFADPLDGEIRLRVVSALASGRLVETRVIAEGPRRKSVFDRLVAWADRARVAARYPDRKGLGVHRQLLDVEDLATLWVTHRGFVRGVQGAGDEVVDHGSTALLAAVLQRAWRVRRQVDMPEVRLAGSVAVYARNALLAVPTLLALGLGLTWWAAGLATVVPAVLAVLSRDAIRSPTWRPWLFLVPFGTLIFGGLTFGMVPAMAALIFDLGIVGLGELAFPTGLRRLFEAIRGEPTTPRPTPFDAG